MPQPVCSIVSIGAELLLGLTLDTNANHLCRTMSRHGWRVRSVRTVADNLDDIVEALTVAAEHSDAVLVTGGLGPTEDDRTRAALARAMGVKLEERADLVKQIEERFAFINRPMRPGNRVQAMIPQGAEGIANPCGTAPGIACLLHGARVFAMPGVPREMRAMLDASVLPALADLSGSETMAMRRLHVFGIGESTVGDLIREYMQADANPLVGTTVRHGIITVRLLAQAEGDTSADDILAPVEADIASRLGPHCFGRDDDTLASVTVNALKQAGRHLAVAESCTGGLIAAAIVDVPGASDVLSEGIVSYANEAKMRRLGVSSETLEQHGAVSRETVLAMAAGARERSGADLAVAVTGIAGPGGGTPDKPVGTVWLALSSGSGVFCTGQRFGADRAGNRARAVHAALDLVRRDTLSLPQPWENDA